MRRAVGMLVAVALLVAGCVGISHLRGLQPPQVTASGKAVVPSSGKALVLSRFQRGVNVDMYTWSGQDTAAASAAVVRYAKSLHANALMVSFPFFVPNGEASLRVVSTPAVPSPAVVAQLARDAVHAGLAVTWRPLLDERSLGGYRGFWLPSHPTAWFRSYARFLRPYARAAQRAGVSEFIVGAELEAMAQLPQWSALDASVRAVFHGTLACTVNWAAHLPNSCGHGLVQLVDAYKPARPPFAVGWMAFDRSLVHGTTLSEVGIDAVPGAWRRPYVHQWPATRLAPVAQVRWFSSACRAAVATALGGIYFWAVQYSAVQQPPSLASQGLWSVAGQRAIASCFARIERSGR